MREIEFREWTHYWEFEKYGVNKNGDVCSFDYNHTGTIRKIKQYYNKDGYKYVFLNVDGKRYKRSVHRMVLSTFVENIFNKPQVNHKNGKRDDNRIDNLEWCTSKENCIHSYQQNGRKPSKTQMELARKRFSGIKNPKHKITQEIANNIKKDRQNGLMLKELSKKYGLSLPQCSAICCEKFWKEKLDNFERLEGRDD